MIRSVIYSVAFALAVYVLVDFSCEYFNNSRCAFGWPTGEAK